MTALRIALRYLVAKKSHTAVNIISAVAIAGVAVAVAAIVIVLSVFNGFSDLGRTQVARVDPPLLLSPTSGAVIERADSLAEVLAALPGVKAVAPVIDRRGLLIADDVQVPVRFKGVPANYAEVVAMDTLVTDGRWVADSMLGLPAMNLSPGVAYHASVAPSTDRLVTLHVPRRRGRINPANPMAAFRSDTLMVWSVWRSDVQQFDADRIIIPLASARRLLDYSDEASAIELSMSPQCDVVALRSAIAAMMPQLKIADRFEQQAEAFRMIAIEKWVTFLLLVFILMIASFNVVATLSLLIIEKRDDMSLLRALGATGRFCRSIFAWQCWLITMAGSAIGLVLGTAAALTQQWGHVIRLNAAPGALTIDYYPVRLDPADLVLILVATTLISLLAARATRLLTR